MMHIATTSIQYFQSVLNVVSFGFVNFWSCISWKIYCYFCIIVYMSLSTVFVTLKHCFRAATWVSHDACEG